MFQCGAIIYVSTENEIILECEDLGSNFEIDYKNKFEFNFIKMANDET